MTQGLRSCFRLEGRRGELRATVTAAGGCDEAVGRLCVVGDVTVVKAVAAAVVAA